LHFLRNTLDCVPRQADDDCLQELRWLYARRNLAEAQHDLTGWLTRWQRKYPKLTNWVEENIASTLALLSPNADDPPSLRSNAALQSALRAAR
jgi:transposase-like protein